MGYKVGLDIGSSTIKIVFMDKGQIVDKVRIDRKESYEDVLINKGLDNIDKIVTVGAGSSYIEGNILNIETEHVEEFESIALGGRFMANSCESETLRRESGNMDNCIVVSLGTGTCFIHVEKSSIDVAEEKNLSAEDKSNIKIQHAGGCGIGGALLSTLADYGLAMKNVYEFMDLAMKGKADNADLLIKDISKTDIDILYPDVTVANMAKINRDSKPEDYAYGACNLVFQNVGVMAVMAARNYNAEKIVVMGSVANHDFAKESFEAVGKLFGAKFVVPDASAFAVAVGAVLVSEKK